MYFKFGLRYNSEKRCSDAYYRLVESCRNAARRVCHRTILNIGFIEDDYTPEQLNLAARMLTSRYEQREFLFEVSDNAVKELAECLWKRIVSEKRLDLTKSDAQSRCIKADTLRHSNVRKTTVLSLGSARNRLICSSRRDELRHVLRLSI